MVAPTTTIGTTGVFQNQDVNGLLQGLAWDTDTITYSFPTAKAQYGNYSDSVISGWEKLDAAHQDVAREAFGLIAQYTGLHFVEITETKSTHAMIRLSGSSNDTRAPTSFAYSPGNGTPAGDVWYGNIRDMDPTRASYVFDSILHEIGHAMGLKHGQDDDGTHGTLPADHDSTEWSIMDYHSYVGGDPLFTNLDGSGSQTYMNDDIAALQYIYGANFDTNSGNTVYTWSPTTGEMFIDGEGQGASTTNTIYESLWDGNGKDTYDLSNYTTDLKVDLRPGQWSTFSEQQLAFLHGFDPDTRPPGNVSNANLYNGDVRSLIENARGGIGDDFIRGNQAANVLTGNDGNDTLRPGTGKDTVKGGDGDDVISFNGGKLIAGDKIDGGAGNDLVLLDSKYTGDNKVVFKSGTIVNVETLKLATDFNYNLTSADGTVGAGKTLVVDASKLAASHFLIFNGGAETDGHFVFKSGQGADTLTGGALSDTFVFASAASSHGATYDTLKAANLNSDKFDVAAAVTGIDAKVKGSLSTDSFDADLTARMSGHLGAHHALLFAANAGTLSGQTFLVVDQNGTAGYQAGHDLVIHLDSQTGSLGTSDFI
jgi:serralysin